MDYARILDRLFPGENVSPEVQSNDYQRIIDTWRGQSVPPSLANCQATWTAIQAEDAAAATPDARAGVAIDSIDRLSFEVNFDQENRIRALEGKAAITRVQYRDALVTRWKQLNP